MANYLLVYHGGSMPETEADQAAAMKAWTDWFTALGDALVDGGNPASQTKILAADGSVSDGGATSPSGYSIIKADAIDAAVALARGCPVLAGGAMVEVVETFEAM
ncbi:MAG: hypothetical protein A2V85_17255 [Chloroflexi bacterium RBG_16_72_14]|nr:MAG: hypothetical protein A2V85_17255 [Chloroflexi bacterium RBG_16_72_14]